MKPSIAVWNFYTVQVERSAVELHAFVHAELPTVQLYRFDEMQLGLMQVGNPFQLSRGHSSDPFDAHQRDLADAVMQMRVTGRLAADVIWAAFYREVICPEQYEGSDEFIQAARAYFRLKAKELGTTVERWGMEKFPQYPRGPL